MKYRKKPVVIDAFQLGIDYIPDWFMDAVTAFYSAHAHEMRGQSGGGSAQSAMVFPSSRLRECGYIPCLSGETHLCVP